MGKGMGCLVSGLTGIGYLGNGLLFLLIEWSFIAESWVQFFNPFLHLQVLIVMLLTPFFWLMTGLILVGVLIEKLAGSAGESTVLVMEESPYEDH